MSQEVYDEIRRLIERGHYIGGDPLPEVELAERLGVSRTPIREALRRLQAEGIAVRRDNRRVYLTETDSRSVIEIFTVRAALEAIAARLATPQVDRAFLDHLEVLVARMDDMLSPETPDLRGYRETNASFHWAILARSGNSVLDSTVRTVARPPLVSPTFNAWDWEELERSQHHHRELLTAFRARDGEWAEAIMRSHMLAARAAFIRAAGSNGDASALTEPSELPA